MARLLLIMLASQFLHARINNIIIWLSINLNSYQRRIMQLTARRSWKGPFYVFKCASFLLLVWTLLFFISGCASTNSINAAPITIPLLEKWSGDYLVSELGRLPEGQQDKIAGYIGDTETFIPVWRVFMPEEILPAVDFRKNIVVFTRNIQFYNRTSILKVELQDGTAEILAMETMSAMPVEEKVAMSMAVIPREGVLAIRAGTEKIPVMNFK
jgi:hypothetical protein